MCLTYSYLNATIGSTEAARRAGIQQASRVAANMRAGPGFGSDPSIIGKSVQIVS